MSRAGKIIEELEILNIRLVETNQCGKQTFIFNTGKVIDPASIPLLEKKIKDIVNEEGLELQEFGAHDKEMFIIILHPELKEKLEKLGKMLEGKLKSAISEKDLEDNHVKGKEDHKQLPKDGKERNVCG